MRSHRSFAAVRIALWDVSLVCEMASLFRSLGTPSQDKTEARTSQKSIIPQLVWRNEKPLPAGSLLRYIMRMRDGSTRNGQPFRYPYY